jgi:hypothetical protein
MEKQTRPPQMMLIDLRDLILSGNYKYLPTDAQRRILEELLAQYVKEYKPCP